MKKYSSLFLLPGVLTEGEVPSQIESLKAFLVSAGAREIELYNLGRQKLAYPIKASGFAYAVDSCFSLEPEKVSLLREKLRLEPLVMRFMITGYRKKEKMVHRQPRPAPKPVLEKSAKVDLAELDKKIEEILQEDKITI